MTDGQRTVDQRCLRVVMYHYVRDLPRTKYPRIKGMLVDDFKAQIARLSERYEMASLSAALDFLNGKYQPRRDLCLLTFDDGLKDHWIPVTGLLSEQKIEGLFFLITAAIEEHRVLDVHKNHFLMAALDLGKYSREFLNTAEEIMGGPCPVADGHAAARTYRWDEPEVREFKYLINFQMSRDTRNRVLELLFKNHLGDEADFARELYLNWDEARQMQTAGMIMGGHTHSHQALATLDEPGQRAELTRCTELLKTRLSPQTRWPFSYPYGKKDSFNDSTVRLLRESGYDCAFCTETGDNQVGQDCCAIRRIDPKDAV